MTLKKKTSKGRLSGMIRTVTLLAACFFCAFPKSYSQGYVQDYNSIGVSVAILNHHADVLDNRENATRYLSQMALLNYNVSISPLFNFHQQLGIGYLQNASDAEDFWTKSELYNYSLGFSLNAPKFFARKYSSRINPYGNVGYQFNYHPQSSASCTTKIISNFLVGGGLSYQLNDHLVVYSQLNLRQRFGSDFQTTFQTQFGINAVIIRKD